MSRPIKFMPVLFVSIFVLALVVFALYLKPAETQSASTQQDDSKVRDSQITTTDLEPEIVSNEVLPEEPEIIENEILELSQLLQDIRDGKKSILSVILDSKDLNQQLSDFYQQSENGESWADYAIGQLAEMCNYLYATPESQLIQMFSGVSARSNPEQQIQMAQLLPVIIDASQRCKTLDADLHKKLGDSRDWFDKAADLKNPNAYVISGYSLLSQKLLAESDEYANAEDEKRMEVSKKIREQAKQEFREQMRQFIVDGETNPETIISMAEHLNLFYENGHPFKSKEAWMLLACQQGYENNCSSSSHAMSVFCMFDNSCQSGGDFQQGILWKQGQFKFDEYQRTASELKTIFDSRDWDKLGF